jgi:hypothetical protein
MVGLHGERDEVERTFGDSVDRLRSRAKSPFRRIDENPFGADLLDLIAPANEGHVVGAGDVSGEEAADGTGPDDGDAHLLAPSAGIVPSAGGGGNALRAAR